MSLAWVAGLIETGATVQYTEAFGGLTAVTSAIKPCLKCRAQVQAEAYEHTGTFKRLNTKWVWVYCTDMNRRNVLIGLGGLVAGGGALVGTGAFDTVEAERDVTVETAGDADAFLGLTQADGASDDLVDEPDDDTIAIDLSGDGTDGDGLNLNARTRFNNLVTITNQGTQDVDSIQLGFSDIPDDGDIDGDLGDTFKFTVSDGPDESDFDGSGATVEHGTEEGELAEILTGDDDVPSELSLGEDVTFGLEIDLIEGGDENDDLPNGDYTLTIEANAAE